MLDKLQHVKVGSLEYEGYVTHTSRQPPCDICGKSLNGVTRHRYVPQSEADRVRLDIDRYTFFVCCDDCKPEVDKRLFGRYRCRNV